MSAVDLTRVPGCDCEQKKSSCKRRIPLWTTAFLSVGSSKIVCMFEADIASLDVDATLSFMSQAYATSDRAEVRAIEGAAHYADLHAVLDTPAALAGVSLPGMERLVELGGDALDLRHRLPSTGSPTDSAS